MKIQYITKEKCPHCGANDWSKADVNYCGSAYAFLCNYCSQITDLEDIPQKNIIWDSEEEREEYEDATTYNYPVSPMGGIGCLIMGPFMLLAKNMLLTRLSSVPYLPEYVKKLPTILGYACPIIVGIGLIHLIISIVSYSKS